MGLISLESSVGLGGRNNPIDVAVVQQLLKTRLTRFFKTKGRSTSRFTPSLKINGECSQTTINLINNIQTSQVGMQQPDGRIDPLGATFKAILPQTNSPSTTTRQLLFGQTPANAGLLAQVNPQRFRKLFIKQAGLGLTITKGEELLRFFNFLQNDPNIKDIRWAAYILATVHKETTYSFKSSTEEAGKGSGKPYGMPQQVVDILGCRGPKNAIYTNIYYGRGYVQLTWDDNYRAIGKAYAIGEELYINPDKALDPAIAYFAASYGMRHGILTGHKLSEYINGKKCDYKKARQIINGSDKHIEIAGRAEKIEILLRLCV